MRRLYSVRFWIEPEEELASVPRFEAVASACLRWALKHGLENFVDSSALDTPLEPIARVPPEGIEAERDAQLQTIAGTSEPLEWALRFSQLDSDDRDIRWTVEVALRREEDGGVDVSCVVFVAREGHMVAPIRRESSAPAVVREVIMAFPCRVDRRLSTSSRPVAPEATLALKDFLLSPSRRLPIVFLSAENRSGRALTDPQNLARWLAGVAHTVHSTSQFTTEHLQNHHGLPQDLAAWDGAIRLYWPGLSLTDDPRHHNLWWPARLRGMSQKAIRESVMRPIALAAAPVFDSGAPSWAILERAIRRQRFEAEGSTASEMAEYYATEAIDMETERNQLQQEVDRLKTELFDREQENESLRMALRSVRSGDGPVQEQDPPVDLAEAVQRAREQYSNELVFALNSSSSVDGNPFERPDEALLALGFLAIQWRDTKMGRGRIEIDNELREHCGWKYRSSQSDVTMNRFKNEYTTKHDGLTFWLEKHLCTRSAKDPRHSLRIAFEWDERTEQVVVGYIGQHQRTAAS